MTTTTTTRTVCCYATGRAIGEMEMSDAQYARYVAAADRYTGAILLSEAVGYGGEYVASETTEDDITVYIEE